MRWLLSMTFTSSLEGPFSSPHFVNTHKVGFTEGLPGLQLTNELMDLCAAHLRRLVDLLSHPLAPCRHFVHSKPLLPPDSDGVFGRVPQSILDDESSHLITAHENSLDLQNLHRVSENAYKQYLKSRPNPSPESIRRVKSTDLSVMAVHPLLGQFGGG